MDVLVVTTEIAPYAKVGHAADVVAGLCKTLVQNGHAVTVAAPRYPAFEEGGLLMARRLSPLELPGGGAATVFDGQLTSAVKVALFDSEGLYNRPGVLGDDAGPYADNAERFGLLSQAAAALVAQRRQQGEGFDVVHAFDWPAAPTLALVAAASDGAVRKVLTVTDTKSRGEFPLSKMSAVGLSRESREPFVVSRKLSYLAMGTRSADVVTLGSPSHVRDLLDGSCGDPTRLLVECGERLAGILDGIDYSLFNPATDAAIKSRFAAEDVANKGTCKTDVVRGHGLPLDVARPLVVAFAQEEEDGRTLSGMQDELARMDANLLVVGAVAPALGGLSEHLGDRVALLAPQDSAALRRIVAGADIAVCPRAYATSAFLPRLAQRYGAVPVGFAAAATLDAVVDADGALETGTGFLAEPSASLVGPLRRALAAYASERWPVLRRRVMRLDVSWDRPARRCAQLYRPTPPARAAGS
jgi:starch synthase